MKPTSDTSERPRGWAINRIIRQSVNRYRGEAAHCQRWPGVRVQQCVQCRPGENEAGSTGLRTDGPLVCRPRRGVRPCYYGQRRSLLRQAAQERRIALQDIQGTIWLRSNQRASPGGREAVGHRAPRLAAISLRGGIALVGDDPLRSTEHWVNGATQTVTFSGGTEPFP